MLFENTLVTERAATELTLKGPLSCMLNFMYCQSILACHLFATYLALRELLKIAFPGIRMKSIHVQFLSTFGAKNFMAY